MTPADYRARAEECIRIANSHHDADMRKRWLELAQQWRALAAQVENMNLGEPGFRATGKPHDLEKPPEPQA
jgi:hypothetical protein